MDSEKGTLDIKEKKYQYRLLTVMGLLDLIRDERPFSNKLERTIQSYRGQDHFRIHDLLLEHIYDETRPQTLYLVVHEEEIVSTCRLLYNPETRVGYINLVYTNPTYRGQQICQHTINLMIQKTKEFIDTYELEVDVENEPAKKCYERNGFVIVEENKEDKTYRMRREKKAGGSTRRKKIRKTIKTRKTRKNNQK